MNNLLKTLDVKPELILTESYLITLVCALMFGITVTLAPVVVSGWAFEAAIILLIEALIKFMELLTWV